MGKALSSIKRELLEMLWPTLFFFVLFTLLACVRSLMVQQYGIPAKSFAAVIISALIVGKSVLIIDAVPYSRYFRKPRIIYNVLALFFSSNR